MRGVWLPLLCVGILGCVSNAENHASKPHEKTENQELSCASPESPEGEQSFEDLTKDAVRIEGFLDAWQDAKTGELRIGLKPGQLDRDILIVQVVRDGVVDVGMFRGEYHEERVVYFRRHFNRVDLVQRNLRYYFDPASPLSRAADANISEPVLFTFPILAEDEESGTILIQWDPFLLSESLAQWHNPPEPYEDVEEDDFELGTLSEKKSRVAAVRSYPRNTDFYSELVYENAHPKKWAEGAYLTDPRQVVIKIQQSFVELPENDYQPRYDDPRVGYFLTLQDDLTEAGPVNYRDKIERWHLVKKDPDAALSEPVEPIVFWIENTTPLEFRPWVEQGVLAWNEAFEAAGFKNAVQVRVQPDDADWDAGDLRYNVIRWTSSPNPPFGGYGPVFSDPRTGQILGSDIMLEFIFATNRMRQDEFFLNPGEALRHGGHGHNCAAGFVMQANMQAGKAVLAAQGAPAAEEARLLKQAIICLTLHEVGHTLGLNHNFAASRAVPLADVLDAQKTQGRVTASVMDYSPTNLPVRQGEILDYFDTRPGLYDVWAVEYGYHPKLDDAEAEAARVAELLARSSQPALKFGNDADNSFSPGAGIDPGITLFDLTSEPIDWAARVLPAYRQSMIRLPSVYGKAGNTRQAIRNGFTYLSALYSLTSRSVAAHIGGIYIDRSVIGQEGAGQPYTPVSATDQRKALALLREHVFHPQVIDLPPELLWQLQPQRRGFELGVETEDPKLHQGVLGLQSGILDQLLDPVRLQRMLDVGLYGGDYPLPDYLHDLTLAIFEDDLAAVVIPVRQNLQATYVNRLGGLVKNEEIAPAIQAPAFHLLKELKGQLVSRPASDRATTAHTAYLIHLIDRYTQVREHE